MRKAKAMAMTILISVLFFGVAGGTASVAQETKQPVIRGVSYVGLTVSDLEASAKLYQEAARLEEVKRERLSGPVFDALAGEGTSAETRLLASSNLQVRLMQIEAKEADSPEAPGAVPVNGPGMAHLCYQGDGKLEIYEKFVEGGVTPLGNPDLVVLNPRNAVVYAYALDHDGIMLEVEHIDVDKVQARQLTAGFHRVRHISLASPDMERIVGFYSVLLDTPKPRQLGGEAGLQGPQFDDVSGLPGTRLQMGWFRARNLEVEVVHYLSHPPTAPTEPRPLTAPGYNMVVFDVTSLDAAKELLLAAGGTVVTDPMPMDGGEIFFGRDPDLNLLGFLVVPEDSTYSSLRFATQP